MAVVVPAFDGDVDRALRSVRHWPSKCSDSTRTNMDLILYYAGKEDNSSTAVFNDLREMDSTCFTSMRLVYGRLTEEEMAYPIGPSVQFFKMFLDEGVKEHFSCYDMLAWIEWDVIVTHDTSFERLYLAAFSNDEPFWVKGSTLAGDNFHTTSALAGSWHILGHLNGNAIYSNTDPTFKEFLSYARAQWGYSYPFDVVMWATVSDFPYSWPLWQRYSRKFVTSSLISNIGFVDVSNRAVENAISGDTLFIHGSSSGGGS
ncbi:unnamed protein product, partial [Choristocarpus tenellus]